MREYKREGGRKPPYPVLFGICLAFIAACILVPVGLVVIQKNDRTPAMASASASVVAQVFEASEDLAYYTEERKASIASSVAKQLNANVADVTVTVTSGSVIIRVEIKTDEPAKVSDTLTSLTGTSEAASSLLAGVSVTTVNAVLPMPSPPPPAPPPPPLPPPPQTVPSPPASPPPPPTIVGLRMPDGITSVEPGADAAQRRRLDLGRFARRLSTKPTEGEYTRRDDQQVYLRDRTADALDTPQAIMCMIRNSKAHLFVNQYPDGYKTLIDFEACNNANSAPESASEAGASAENSAPVYSELITTPTRASNDDPAITTGHMLLMDDLGNPTENIETRVYYHINQTIGVNETYFNGQFKMVYTILQCVSNECETNPQLTHRGILDVAKDDIPGAIEFAETYFEPEANGYQSARAHIVTAQDKANGSGVVSDFDCCDQSGAPYTETTVFGFVGNPGDCAASDGCWLCIKDDDGDVDCYDRTNKIEAVHRYGLYKANGEPFLEGGAGGFELVSRVDATKTYWANSEGVWPQSSGNTYATTAGMDGLELDAIDDDSKSYRVKVLPVKVRMFSPQSSTLDAGADMLPFRFSFHQNVTLNGTEYNRTCTSSGWYYCDYPEFYAQWSKDAGEFEFLGTMDPQYYGVVVPFSDPVRVNASEVQSMLQYGGGIHGESGRDTQVRITDDALAGADPGSVAGGFVRTTVIEIKPGNADLVNADLACVERCFSADTLEALNATSNFDAQYVQETVYDDNGYRPASSLQEYTFDSAAFTLTMNSGKEITHTLIDHATIGDNINSMHVHSRLYPASALSTSSSCNPDAGSKEAAVGYCYNGVSNSSAAFYEIQVATDWHHLSSSTSLTDITGTSTPTQVTFEQPIEVVFKVPDEESYGRYAGTSSILTYRGFGRLDDFPYVCIDRDTHEELTNCHGDNGNNVDWVPRYSIPYSDLGYVQRIGDSNETLWAKWLDKDIRFKYNATVTADSKGITFGSEEDLPDAPSIENAATDPENPVSSASAKYAGPWPTAIVNAMDNVVVRMGQCVNATADPASLSRWVECTDGVHYNVAADSGSGSV